MLFDEIKNNLNRYNSIHNRGILIKYCSAKISLSEAIPLTVRFFNGDWSGFTDKQLKDFVPLFIPKKTPGRKPGQKFEQKPRQQEVIKPKRNPDWTKDEIILALDLYFRVSPIHTSEKNQEIIKLSNLLNILPIHSERLEGNNFRNPTGVYMKLCNFLRLDPNYPGKGLDAGSKLDEEIWNEFSNDRERLAAVASAIKRNYDYLESKEQDGSVQSEDEEFPEGRVLSRLHRLRERNATLVKNKKKQVLKAQGKLVCEICGFDFKEFYGDLGEGYIECHHTIAVSELEEGRGTKLSELSLVCSNCHKMLHRKRPWLTKEQLKQVLNTK